VIIIQPRGLRAYVRNDTFFAAVRILQPHLPAARYLCPAMANETQAEYWARGMEQQVRLLPRLTRTEMADAFRQAQIVLSITTHDGTPNTLLEALACGCFPIAGNIPSLREWIEDGVNGLLVDPGDAMELARAIERAVADAELRQRAWAINQRLIAERADYAVVMPKAEQMLAALIV